VDEMKGSGGEATRVPQLTCQAGRGHPHPHGPVGGEKGVRAADVTKRKRMRLKEWREHVVKSSPKRYGSDTKTAFSPVKFFQLGGILL
jgi:hypothetical protein